MEKRKNSAIEKVEKMLDKDEGVDYDERLTKEYEDLEIRREALRERNAELDREEKERRARVADMRKKLRDERIKERKELKRNRSEERAAASDMLKAENETDKAARKNAEKKAAAEMKEGNSGSRRGKRKYGGLIAAVAVLSAAVLVMGTMLIMRGEATGGGSKEKGIETAFYNFGDNVDAAYTALSKLIVSSDKGQQQKLLGEVSVRARLAAENVAVLPLKDENKFNTIKLANQISDYAKYLNNRLIDGDSLKKEDFETLKEIKRITAEINEELHALSSDMGDDFDFSSILDEKSDNIVLKKFGEFEKGSVDYPKLIYDGPFSDALEAPVVKGLPETGVTLEEAKEIFLSAFGGEDIKSVEEVGETAGKIETYDFKARIDDETEIYANVSKRGGKLISFNYFADCSENKFGLGECKTIAEDLLTALGVKDMKAVWATDSGPTAYINFAYEKDGVVFYKDMIKLTVCKERGVVSNFDAREYYLNHDERDVGVARISEAEAGEKVSKDIKTESVRLAYIPYGETKEVLCYEFCGRAEDGLYYIYIDADTGVEREILKVISSAEGDLLA